MPSITVNRIHYPMLVSNDGTADLLSPEQDSQIWKKFRFLPKIKQDIITDPQMSIKLVELQDNLQLPDAIVGVVSLCIRELFFQEINFSDAEKKIGMVLSQSGFSLDIAKGIVQFIEQEIMTIAPKLSSE